MTFARKGIRCNTPGLMKHAVGRASAFAGGRPPGANKVTKTVAGGDLAALIAKRNAAGPMCHMGTAWDVAHAVSFLASDEARYITGTDGGMSVAGMG